MGECYLAKVLTEKGNRLMSTAGWNSAVDVKDCEEKHADLKQDAEAKIRSHIQTDRLNEINTIDIFNAPFWEDVSFSCINCGICTYVCPTCWCFDIQDENRGTTGVRMRNWDSCMYPLFTHHGSGHNPRNTKMSRIRQRFMHKLKYFPDQYDAGIQCVGCGRCIRFCPVNIDIRSVCNLMNRFDASACIGLT
jgi:ferredoxin